MKITEKSFDGAYVKLSGGHAEFGFSSPVQRKRCEYILARETKAGKTEFEICETPVFELCGPMIDVSRGAALTVDGVKKAIDGIAKLGLNMLMLYTEDAFELPGYPLFGYMNPLYSLAELQEIDAYAASLGIEVIPCLQTLGHLAKYLRWGETPADRDGVLLVDDERTYRFIEAEIEFMHRAFRSRSIHIGMDEADGLGLGRHLREHGNCDKAELFRRHLNRVLGITEKYGYKPMIWCDMYYGFSSLQDYYERDFTLPQEVIDGAAKNVNHVFWDYYHTDYDYYDKKFTQEERFGVEILFGGGIWTWDGFLPNFRYTLESSLPALRCAIDHGVKKVIATMWCSDGGQTDYLLAMHHLAVFSEMCWKGSACTEADIYAAAEYAGGENAELINAVSDYWAHLEGSHRIGTGILCGDLLLDTMCYDADLNEIAGLYEKSLATLEKYSGAENVPYYRAVFEATFLKCRLLRDVRREYLAGNREYLARAAKELIPELSKKLDTLYAEFKKRWAQSYKRIGFERFPVRFGGEKARLQNVAEILLDYAEGRLDRIEELDAARQKMKVSWKTFNFYKRM